MKQFGLYNLWKCHKETSYVAILNKKKCYFFIYKIEEQKGRTGPSMVAGERWRKGIGG
jgi:hypothetical protein